MSPKWIILVVMVWIILAVLVGVAEDAFIGGGIDPATGEPIQTSVLNDLMTSKTLTAPTLGARISMSFSDDVFWSAIATMMLFDFPGIFYGSWMMLQWIFFLPLMIGFAIILGGYIMAHIPVIGRGS